VRYPKEAFVFEIVRTNGRIVPNGTIVEGVAVDGDLTPFAIYRRHGRNRLSRDRSPCHPSRHRGQAQGRVVRSWNPCASIEAAYVRRSPNARRGEGHLTAIKQRLCECGCRTPIPPGVLSRYLAGHRSFKVDRRCFCGCGTSLPAGVRSNYIAGHR
jgi:hypothetical protein